MRKGVFFFILIFSVLIYQVFSADNGCGNGICDSFETYLSCPEDCPSGSKDNYCDNAADGICDRDCIKTDSDCKDFDRKVVRNDYSANEKEEGIPAGVKVAGVAVFFIIILVVLFIMYKKANKRHEYYDQGQINKFSMIQRKKKEGTWSNQSEGEIMDNIRDSEDFEKYANQ